MKNNILKLFLSLIFVFYIVFVFCQQPIYTKFYYPDSTLSSEGFMLNNEPIGYWKNYNTNGILKSEGKRTNSMLDSIWKFYFDNGLLKEQISYLNGEKSGYYFTYNQLNDSIYLYSKELYIKNNKENFAYIYSSDNKLYQSLPYINNKKEGTGFEFSKDSSIIKLLHFKNNELIDIEIINQFTTQGKKNGIWKEFYNNGSIKSEENFEHGHKSGCSKLYSKEGNLIFNQFFSNDSVFSYNDTVSLFITINDSVRFYNNDNKEFTGSFKNNVPIGIHRYFSDNGSIINSIIYENGIKQSEGIYTQEGLKQGLWKQFYANGVILSKGYYNANKRNGLWKYFYSSGTLKQEGNFINDLYSGIWIWYYENGSIRKKEEYLDGKLNGYIIEYDENANIITQGFYIDNLKDGEWFFKSGDQISKGHYKFDEKDGLWNQYYLNNQLTFEGLFIHGKPHKIHRFYYNDGVLEHNEKYKYGKKSGSWNYYNKYGVLIKQIFFKKGIEYQIRTY